MNVVGNKKLTAAMVCMAYLEAKKRRQNGTPMVHDVHPWFQPQEQTFIQEGRWRWMPYDILHEWTDQPYDECWVAMLAAVKTGHVIFGLNLRWGWLTPKGEQLVRSTYGTVA